MNADDVVAGLRAAFHAPGSPVHEHVGRLDSAVARGELPSATLAEASLRLLETLVDADGFLDMVATEILTAHGDPSALPRLRAVRPRLRPRVALRDWRFEVDRLMDVLEARAANRCACAAEAAHAVPPRGAHWTVEEESSPEPYLTRRRVRCGRCGRSWTVVEEDGYHYPIFRWEAG
jgi:DNA-binding GntR family transcriptional regulator